MTKQTFISLTFSLLGCIYVAKGSKVDTSVYMDPTRRVDERVEALLQQMTLREKIAQMDMVSIWDRAKVEKNSYYDFGAWIAGVEPQESNKIQSLSQTTRLKIPYLIGMDAAHGYATLSGRTIYPTSISMAATFNRELVKQSAMHAGREIRSAGTHWTFAPSVDIVYDARWGRTGETYGEDPYLSSELVKEAIWGLQNNPDPQKRVAACMKHLAGGGASVGGVNHASADISERSVRSYILPPFKAGIEAGCMTIMPGHNDIGGVPVHASKWLLTDVVKEEFGFNGLLISDMKDVENLQASLHFVAEDLSDAIKQSINAGLDMHMYSTDSLDFLIPMLDLAKDGLVSTERIDDAVRRILKIKFELGLFENRYVDPKNDIYATKQDRHVALNGARECIVLLKNDQNVLPLDAKKYKKILVTGPNADNQSILGDWSFFQPEDNVVTILEGIKNVSPKSEIIYSNSGRIKSKISGDKTNTTDPEIQKQMLSEGGGISDFSIQDAVAKAKECDLAIVAVGGYGVRSDWGLRTYGESADRPSIDLYGRQEELVRAIEAVGIPVVVVIVNGKPLNNQWITQNIPTIVDLWEPGMYGGQALAEILYGKVNPSGKLPMTVPQNAGQVPMYYYQNRSRYWTGYGLGSNRADDKPAFCFGHGLSYTTFEYSDLKMDSLFTNGQAIKLSFTVKNSGELAGKDVPMLFVQDCISSVVTPTSLLKEFTKIELQPGEQRLVEFIVPCQSLGLWNQQMKYVVEPGAFLFKIGRSVDDIKLTMKIMVQ